MLGTSRVSQRPPPRNRPSKNSLKTGLGNGLLLKLPIAIIDEPSTIAKKRPVE